MVEEDTLLQLTAIAIEVVGVAEVVFLGAQNIVVCLCIPVEEYLCVVLVFCILTRYAFS